MSFRQYVICPFCHFTYGVVSNLGIFHFLRQTHNYEIRLRPGDNSGIMCNISDLSGLMGAHGFPREVFRHFVVVLLPFHDIDHGVTVAWILNGSLGKSFD